MFRKSGNRFSEKNMCQLEKLRPPLLQEAADGRVGFEPDRPLVGGVGRIELPGSRQQPGARRPIRLIVAETRIVGQRVERGNAGRSPARLGHRDRRLMATTGEPVIAASAS